MDMLTNNTIGKGKQISRNWLGKHSSRIYFTVKYRDS